MSVHVPFRSFNRSQRARIGGVTLNANTGAWVNIESPRVKRDIARHATLGAVFPVGAPLGFTSDGYLVDGGVVTYPAQGLVLNISASYFTRNSGANGTQVADTVTLTTGAANPRIDVVCIDTATPDIVKIDGTATANANIYNRLGVVADLPANRIPIALVLVPGGSVTNLDTATIVPLR